MKYGPSSRLHDILQSPQACAVVERALPGLFDREELDRIRGLPLRFFTDRHPAVMGDPDKAGLLWRELAAIEAVPAPRSMDPVIQLRRDYECGDVAEGSAAATVPPTAQRWSPVEVRIDGPSHGNPFTEVDLTARFSLNDVEMTVGGFYDGNGRWIIRFLPETTGTLRFTTSSTARSLHGISGEVQVGQARDGDHGPVRVDGLHFAHADGTRHVPLGTTAYAWLHQPSEVRAATLRTLRKAPFTKLRMTVFPKSYDFNSNDPDLYPFVRREDGGFDFTRFDPRFFRRLEQAVTSLGTMGIEADIILFHPYDRWGFAAMGPASDDRYVRYLVRRLWAYPNVWWSMANEYDFLWTKCEQDWERMGGIVAGEDPARHPRSIHNGATLYDNSRDWITHASLQGTDRYRTAENIDGWRATWKKPVLVDECGYEGNLPFGWGNLSGQELIRRFWEGAVRGGYVGHGETYYRNDEQIWWAKGGELVGDAPDRVAFLRRVIEEGPGGALDPIPLETDAPAAGVPGQYYLIYYGFGRPLFCDLPLPAGEYQVDVIDTWNMTVDSRRVTCDRTLHVDLPGREYIALRLTVLGRAGGETAGSQ
jgi:Domain of unknown function (DUF5605)/Domain of unknown function (DUF5060)/Protein of unknown function (DUF4038)